MAWSEPYRTKALERIRSQVTARRSLHSRQSVLRRLHGQVSALTEGQNFGSASRYQHAGIRSETADRRNVSSASAISPALLPKKDFTFWPTPTFDSAAGSLTQRQGWKPQVMLRRRIAPIWIR